MSGWPLNATREPHNYRLPTGSASHRIRMLAGLGDGFVKRWCSSPAQYARLRLIFVFAFNLYGRGFDPARLSTASVSGLEVAPERSAESERKRQREADNQ